MVLGRSVSASFGAVKRNPIIIVFSLLFALLQLPALFAGQLDPGLSTLVSLVSSVLSVAIVPFVMGGMIGMADEGLDGHTSASAFIEYGKSNYVRVLAAYLLLVALMVVLYLGVSIVGGILTVIVGISVLSSGAGSGTMMGVFFLLFAFTFLVMAIPAFFFQFFAHAVVLDDMGIVDSFKRSFGVVRNNFLTVLGYFLVVMVAGFVSGLVGGIGSLLGTASQVPGGLASLPSLSLPVVLAIQVVGVLLVGLYTSFYWPFSVAVYQSVRDTTPSTGESATEHTSAL
jgi:hypothetical protein